MSQNNDHPLTSIETPNGTVWSPRYHKNTNGAWELNDKSFQQMITPLSDSEQNARPDEE